jgi:hypothetical protein
LHGVTVKVADVVWLRFPLVPLIDNRDGPTGVLEIVVTVRVDVPEAVTEVGLKLETAPGGKPVTLNPTLPLKPPDAVTVTVKLALLPADTERDVGETDIAKSGGIAGCTVSDTDVECVVLPPVPVIVMLDVLWSMPELVVTVIVEVPELNAGGVKITVAPEGTPLALNVTLALNPPDGVIVTV